MCKIVILREMLGARETNYSLWDGRQVVEMTAKQIKEAIKSNIKICGLTLDNEENLVLDKEGFYCNDIMEHRHCGNYSPMISNDGLVAANLFYIVIGSEKGKDVTTTYQCISTRFERLSISEADLRAYMKIGVISAGCKVEKDGTILLHLWNIQGQKPIKKKQNQQKKVQIRNNQNHGECRKMLPSLIGEQKNVSFRICIYAGNDECLHYKFFMDNKANYSAKLLVL